MRFVTEHRTPGMTRFATDVMDAAADLRVVGAAVLLALVLVVALRAWRAALAGMGAFIIASGLAPVLKAVVGRPRPPGALALVDLGGYAMPSSHALLAASMCTAVVVALRMRRPAVRLLVVAVVVAANVAEGVLMVYLGAHWPTDVLAGWLTGALVGWLVAALVLRIFPFHEAPLSAARPAA
jgi:membrane-associated phospholipid phosphatase